MKLLIWGIGKVYNNVKNLITDEIVAYVDNNHIGKIMDDGIEVSSFEMSLSSGFDRILITSTRYKEEILSEINAYNEELTKKVIFWENYFSINRINSDLIVDKQQKPENYINYNWENIYVICPNLVKTGGTELLHQLVYEINQISPKAIISYSEKEKTYYDAVNPNFRKYIGENVIWVDDIIDVETNLIIIPEVFSDYVCKFSRAQIYFWWLSVDNFINTGGMNNLNHIAGRVTKHLYQSEYARLFLNKIGINESNCEELSDYINDDFFEDRFEREKKEDIVAYNPKKGYLFTQELIQYAKDICFVSICNMTNTEVKQLLSKSKVYIDFGNHPGKDRIPREAALLNCCIITGKRGAALNPKDVRIPEQYKWEEEQNLIPKIVKQITDCFSSYDEKVAEFKVYRESIKEERKIFLEQVCEVFFDGKHS